MSMKVAFVSKSVTKKDLVVVILDESLEMGPNIIGIDKEYKGIISDSINSNKLNKTKGSSLTLIANKDKKIQEILIYCIGEIKNFNSDKADRIGGSIFSLISKSISNLTIYVEPNKKHKIIIEDLAARIVHGMKLRSYTFFKYKLKNKSKHNFALNQIEIIIKDPSLAKKYYSPLQSLEEGVYLTRNLVSEPANILTPKTLAEDGVAMGSANEPRVVSMTWKGTKNTKSKPEVCFVGKGVTFDTGGISIKPSGGMQDMKWDMGGSGVVIGLMKALAGRKAKVNISAVVGLVENMPSGKAQRPGDVVVASSGHSIEVINTDAEGRLVLADAVTYAINKFKPKRLIDLATLTGAVIVSLGPQRAGLFSNNDELANNIFNSGEKTGEKVWRLPVGEEYDDDIKSAIADMHNVGSGRGAGATSGAKFIEQFVQNIPWAHLDIAGVTWAKSNSELYPAGGTAFGVRLLNTYVKDFFE